MVFHFGLPHSFLPRLSSPTPLPRDVLATFKVLPYFFHRNWSATELLKSSTWRELATVKYSLEAFNNNLAGHRVRWNTDNQNVVRIVRHPPVVRACCLGRNLMIHVPPGGLHDLIYAPPVVRACCLGRNLMIHVPLGSLHDLIYAHSGGAGLLIRPEVMFLGLPGSLHDVLHAPRGLHNVL